MRFEVDPFRKYRLLNGLDNIGLTLQHADKVRAYEAAAPASATWPWRQPASASQTWKSIWAYRCFTATPVA